MLTNITKVRMSTYATEHRLSPIEQLPIELWLQVCSHLDYFTLKKLYLLSKSFHRLLSFPDLDEALFRWNAEPTGNAAIIAARRRRNALPPRVHPFLAKLGSFIDYNVPKEVSGIKIHAQQSDKSWPLTSTSLMSEPAILPPVSMTDLVIMRGYHSLSHRIEPRQGSTTPSLTTGHGRPLVTVGDVMRSMTEYVNNDGRRLWQNVGTLSLESIFVGWEIDSYVNERARTDPDGEKFLVDLVARFSVWI